MKKDNLKSVTVLSIICLVVAIAMAAVNYITAPVIEENDEAKIQASLKEVLPEAESFKLLDLPEGSPDTVTAIYEDEGGTGYAVTVSTKSSYSKNPLTFTIAVSSDGKIIDTVITNYSETKDFGKEEYPAAYKGVDAENVLNVDTVSGATYSSSAFRDAVADVFCALELVGGEG